MRRTSLLLASMALAVLLASGVALAVTKNCKAGADFCFGTEGPDTINGSEQRDKIYSLGGNDKLYGNGGNDSVNGGANNDRLVGAEGDDNLNGGNGDDLLWGGAGNDQMHQGTYGNDKIYGNAGSEYIVDYKGINVAVGGKGADVIESYPYIYGGPGNDDIRICNWYDLPQPTKIVGGSGRDEILPYCGSSADTIDVRDGIEDKVSCGDKTDTVYFDRGLDQVNPFNCENRRPQ